MYNTLQLEKEILALILFIVRVYNCPVLLFECIPGKAEREHGEPSQEFSKNLLFKKKACLPGRYRLIGF